mgnify:CR=1 FL=1
MANFNEHALELSIMELFKDEGYIYLAGEQIHRERTEVLLADDLRQYLYNRYAKDGITPGEVDGILLRLRNISGTVYEANKAIHKLLCDGFILNREDRTQKDLYIELIDYDNPENNIFKAVNQFEIEGVGGQLRIPDGIVFVNGSGIQECRQGKHNDYGRLQAAHRPLPQRYSGTAQIQRLCGDQRRCEQQIWLSF